MNAADNLAREPANHATGTPHGSQGPKRVEAPGDASGGVLDILARFIEALAGSADGLIEVHADRIRLSVRRKVVQAALAAAAALCGGIWIGAAALATLRGLCGGLASLWGGRVWLGDLSGGLLALALAAGGVALFLRTSSRREFERLKNKYEGIRNKHDAAASNDGGTPRSGGGAGDPEDHGVGAQHG